MQHYKRLKTCSEGKNWAPTTEAVTFDFFNPNPHLHHSKALCVETVTTNEQLAQMFLSVICTDVTKGKSVHDAFKYYNLFFCSIIPS